MSRHQFNVRTLFLVTLVVAAFLAILRHVPFKRWPDAGRGIFILVGSIAGAALVLIEKQPATSRNIRFWKLFGWALMALMGFCGVFSALFESR
jgi:hypothetical protein